MLKDAGMTVPKSKETSVVYMQQYICNKTGDEGSIYACSKTGDEGMQNVHNPRVAFLEDISTSQPRNCCSSFWKTSSEQWQAGGIVGGISGLFGGGLAGAGAGAGIGSAVSNESAALVTAREVFKLCPGFREEGDTVYCTILS